MARVASYKGFSSSARLPLESNLPGALPPRTPRFRFLTAQILKLIIKVSIMRRLYPSELEVLM